MSKSMPTLLFVISLLSAGASARVVDNLTLARVPVADRSDIEFARGTSKALESVLGKLTGSSSTARSEQGRAVLAKAKRLVQQFGYEKLSRADGTDNLLLRVEFDAPALTHEMRGQGIALWGKQRPETRLYVTIVDGGERATLTANNPQTGSAEAEVIEIITRQAANRGIPISFPSAAKVALFEPADNMASALSAALELEQEESIDGVAVAAFTRSALGLWESQWAFSLGGENGQFSREGDMVALLAEEATDSLADVVGRRYANPALLSRNDPVSLKIHGVFDASDYARVTRYLGSLDSVQDLFLRQAQGQSIVVNAVVQGGYQGLGQNIAFGKILAPIDESPGEFRLLSR